MNWEQQKAYDAVIEGKNILLTGSAGTGKSYTIQHIIQYLKENQKKYAITATTGTAAVLIGGQTIHSYMGLGLGNQSMKDIIKRITRYPSIFKELQQLEVLVIDEVSMLDAELFDKMSVVMAAIKANYNKNTELKNLPFGGIQLILVGDFCQLSPVKGYFCFLADVWSKMDFQIIVLQELVRQEGDTLFQKLLQIVRKGKCTENILKVLERLKDTKFSEGIRPTKLYPINVDVDKINQEEIAKLKKEGHRSVLYKAQGTAVNSSLVEKYHVELTMKAQVIITRNIDISCGIVNGKRGVITHLDVDFILIKDKCGDIHKIEYFRDINEKEYNSWISHMPVRICYALSIHKAQGMTIDALELDLGKNIFTYGQAYTALSRAKNLKSIKIIDVDRDSFKINPYVKKFYEGIY